METVEQQASPVTMTSPRPPRAGQFATATIMVVLVATVLQDLTRVITVSLGRVLVTFGGADGRLPLNALPQLLEAELRAGSQGTLADAALSLRLFSALPSLIHAVTVTVAAILLIGIIRRVSLGRPFTTEVLFRWRWLTVTLLGGGFIQALADTWATVYLSTNLGMLGASSRPRDEVLAFLGGDYSGIGIDIPQWPIPILLAGIITLAFAAAFRTGARLEAEADGVV